MAESKEAKTMTRKKLGKVANGNARKAKKPSAAASRKTATKKAPARKAASRKTQARKTAAKKTAQTFTQARPSSAYANGFKKPAQNAAFFDAGEAFSKFFGPDVMSFTTPSTSKEMETIMSKSKDQFEQFTSEFTTIGRDSMEAFIKSGTLFAKGFEDIMRTSMTLAQDAAEKQARFMKEAMTSKTLNEFTEKQSKIAQASFDDFMAGATKLSELSVKVLTQSAEPINNQMTKTVQKASESLAA